MLPRRPLFAAAQPMSPGRPTEARTRRLASRQRGWTAQLSIVMTLATANGEGVSSARIVLLRGIAENGFVFYTNYQSRKARELKENCHAALVFHWPVLSRQVRVEGAVEIIPVDDSDRYFANRPRGHQLGAHASPQSSVIPSRQWLEKCFDSLENTLQGHDVPRPESWGGYLLIPNLRRR